MVFSWWRDKVVAAKAHPWPGQALPREETEDEEEEERRREEREGKACYLCNCRSIALRGVSLQSPLTAEL